jgi:hypothetical protein
MTSKPSATSGHAQFDGIFKKEKEKRKEILSRIDDIFAAMQQNT